MNSLCALVDVVDTSDTEFRMASSGMAWMNSETKEIVPVPASDIKWAQWIRVARNFRLRVGMKDKREVFDGFLRDVRIPPLALVFGLT